MDIVMLMYIRNLYHACLQVCQIRTDQSGTGYYNAGDQSSAQFLFDDTNSIYTIHYSADTAYQEFENTSSELREAFVLRYVLPWVFKHLFLICTQVITWWNGILWKYGSPWLPFSILLHSVAWTLVVTCQVKCLTSRSRPKVNLTFGVIK